MAKYVAVLDPRHYLAFLCKAHDDESNHYLGYRWFIQQRGEWIVLDRETLPSFPPPLHVRR